MPRVTHFRRPALFSNVLDGLSRLGVRQKDGVGRFQTLTHSTGIRRRKQHNADTDGTDDIFVKIAPVILIWLQELRSGAVNRGQNQA